MDHQGLIGAKNRKNSKFELGEKLDHYSWVKFHCESNGDSFDTLKRCLDPEMGHKSHFQGHGQKLMISAWKKLDL